MCRCDFICWLLKALFHLPSQWYCRFTPCSDAFGRVVGEESWEKRHSILAQACWQHLSNWVQAYPLFDSHPFTFLMGCFSHRGNTGLKSGRLTGGKNELIEKESKPATCLHQASKPQWGCPTVWICGRVRQSQNRQGRAAAGSPNAITWNSLPIFSVILPSPQRYSPSSRCPLLQCKIWSQEGSLVPCYGIYRISSDIQNMSHLYQRVTTSWV